MQTENIYVCVLADWVWYVAQKETPGQMIVAGLNSGL